MASDEISISPSVDVEFLNRFNPSERILLDWLRKRVNDSMLRNIAEADYGMDAENHFQVLAKVRDGEQLPVPLRWVPREVLELIRWSQPDKPSCKPGFRGTRGHLMRAFACTLLLRAAAEPENIDYTSGEYETIIQLVESAIALGNEATEATLSFLCWCFPLVSALNERPFYAMAILLLQVFLSKHDKHGEDLLVTCGWVINEEARVRSNDVWNLAVSNWWLLGLTFHSQRHQAWETLTRKILLEPSKPHPSKAAETLQIIGLCLVGEV
jgi:hypothetical protein